MSDDKSNPNKRMFVSTKTREDLTGFEDALDLINKDKNHIEVTGNRKERQIEDYQIYDFLEKEIARLEKLDQFFTIQMPLEKKYSQTRKLIKKESAQLHVVKDEIIELISHNDSNLCNFLESLIRRTY